MKSSCLIYLAFRAANESDLQEETASLLLQEK